MYINNETLDKLVTLFKSHSFNSDQIKRMLKKYRFYRKDIDTIEESYAFYESKMIEFGYSQFEIIEISIYRPRTIFSKFYRKHDIRESYKEYLKTLREEIVNEELGFEYDGIIDVLKDLGVSENLINSTFLRSKDIIFLTPEDLRNNIKYLTDNGLSKEDIGIIVTKNIKILGYGEEDYKELLDVMEEFNMNMRDVVDIFRRQKRALYFNIESATSVFKWALDKKLDKKKFKVNVKKMPNILHCPITSLDMRFDNLIKLGFDEQEATTVIDGALSVLTNGSNSVKEKMEALDEYNISNEDKIRMIVDYPGYLTMSLENIQSKLKIAFELGHLEYIIKRPKNLIQGTKLTIARTYFLTRYYHDLPKEMLSVKVYIPEEQFLSQFKRTNSEVLDIYDCHLKGRKLVKEQNV